MPVKQCPDCGAVKNLREFYSNKHKPDGRQSYCKPCHRERNRANQGHRVRKPVAPADSRRWHFKYMYGISETEYDSMHAAQEGLCAICQQPPPPRRRLVVDHCHDTGRVRGLLCSNCNTALGFARDNTTVLKRAAAYLEAHPK